MIWKAVIHAFSSTWAAYGRAVFVEADDEATARERATDAAAAEYIGSRIEIDRIGVSTVKAREQFMEWKARQRAWMDAARKAEAGRHIIP